MVVVRPEISPFCILSVLTCPYGVHVCRKLIPMFREAIYRNCKLANASAIMHDFLVSSLHMRQLNREASLGWLQRGHVLLRKFGRDPSMMYKHDLEHPQLPVNHSFNT